MNNKSLIEKRVENEKFFSMVIESLAENGKYWFPEAMVFFTKRGDRLYGDQNAIEKIKGLVRDEFLKKRFSLEK